jgi:predicted nucleic acid-binding protein
VILADTSVWVDHLRESDSLLVTLLERHDVLVHPWVIGELALGSIRNRDEILSLLATMPQAAVIDHDAVLDFISTERLYRLGIGLVDVQLLATAHVTSDVLLWTRDRRLGEVASRLSVRFDEEARSD